MRKSYESLVTRIKVLEDKLKKYEPFIEPKVGDKLRVWFDGKPYDGVVVRYKTELIKDALSVPYLWLWNENLLTLWEIMYYKDRVKTERL